MKLTSFKLLTCEQAYRYARTMYICVNVLDKCHRHIVNLLMYVHDSTALLVSKH